MGCTTAVVNGKHSNQCYLDAMKGAFDSYAVRAARKGIIIPENGQCVTDFLDHLLFHIPYPRMVEYASAAVFRHDWSKCARSRKVEEEIGPEPKEGDYRDPGEYQAAEAGYARAFARSPQFQQAFEAKVRDTATLSRQIGNIYTGSIYLGLASLMELGRLQAGQRLGLGAYGSGCSALFFSGRVEPQAEDLPRLGLMERLAERKEITLADYEMLHEGKREKSVLEPRQEFTLAGIDSQGYRHYKFVE